MKNEQVYVYYIDIISILVPVYLSKYNVQYRGGVVVKALSYKPAGREFISRV
jgi:hypothetical protein